MNQVLTFTLAREALKYIINFYGIKNIYIPYYLCDVIRHTVIKEKCKPIFYHIDDNFFPINSFPENAYILYPNYFGICSQNVQKLVNKYPNLIVDNAHAYFDKPSGFACFNAGHKFGYSDSFLFLQPSNKSCYSNNLYDDAQKRKEKFLKLEEKYHKINTLKPDLDSVPFVYPLLAESTENADKIVKELEKEGQTIYRYWNPLPKNFNEYKFYSRLVPIPL